MPTPLPYEEIESLLLRVPIPRKDNGHVDHEALGEARLEVISSNGWTPDRFYTEAANRLEAKSRLLRKEVARLGSLLEQEENK